MSNQSSFLRSQRPLRYRETYSDPAKLQNSLIAWIRIISQRKRRPHNQANDAKEVHREPEIINLWRVIPAQVEIGT